MEYIQANKDEPEDAAVRSAGSATARSPSASCRARTSATWS